MVQMNLGDNFLGASQAAEAYKASKTWPQEWKGLEQRASGRKSQREKWLGSEPEMYWQVRVTPKGGGWSPNYSHQKAKQEISFIHILSASVRLTKQMGGKGTECGGFLCSVLIYIFRFTEHICFSKGLFEVALKLGSDSIPQKCKLWGRFETGLKPWRHHDISCCLWKSSLNTGKPVADLQSNQFLKWELICSEEENASSSWIHALMCVSINTDTSVVAVQ